MLDKKKIVSEMETNLMMLEQHHGEIVQVKKSELIAVMEIIVILINSEEPCAR
jgi:hypothetical protein